MIVSVYTKSGERAATTYYRIYQYLRDIPINFYKRKMLSDKMYRKVMPISDKNIVVKVFIFIYIYLRVTVQLTKDLFICPDTLVISRRFINRRLPIHFKLILNSLKKRGTNIIWDFDDQIIVSKEVSKKGFRYMSELADHIIVASEYNYKMVSEEFRNKVSILPTTDGDMYKLFNTRITSDRLKKLETEIRIIWIGTSVSLKYVEQLIPALRILGEQLVNDRKISLTVVCDKPLEVKGPGHLNIRNIKWERDIAIKELLNSHIGIMPLEETSFSKGKGGFKLIQYLSVGLPIIGSPVGINTSIITKDVGFLEDIKDENGWVNAIRSLISSIDTWKGYSQCAFKKWLEEYNYEQNLEFWSFMINDNKSTN